MKVIKLFFAVLIFSFSVSDLHADIYTWTDENGVKHYSDKKPPDQKKPDQKKTKDVQKTYQEIYTEKEDPLKGEDRNNKGFAEISLFRIGILLLAVSGTAVLCLFLVKRRINHLQMNKKHLAKNQNYFHKKNDGSSVRSSFVNYGTKVVKTVIDASILLAATAVIYTVLLLTCKFMWEAYRASPVGRRYAEMFSARAQNISDILTRDPFNFSIQVVAGSFAIAVLIGAFFTFLGITRYLYHPRGILGRIAFFGLPITGVVAFHLQSSLQINQWISAYVSALIPTMCLFPRSFKYTYDLLPELGSVLRKFGLWKKKVTITSVPPLYLHNLESYENNNLREFDSINGKLTGNRFLYEKDAEINGIYARKNKHDLCLYRYGRDIVFMIDDREIVIDDYMSALWEKTGWWKRSFDLQKNGESLFSITYPAQISHIFTRPLFSNKPARDFFKEMSDIVNDKDLIKKIFLPQDDTTDIETYS
jgi:hypothetical protein